MAAIHPGGIRKEAAAGNHNACNPARRSALGHPPTPQEMAGRRHGAKPERRAKAGIADESSKGLAAALKAHEAAIRHCENARDWAGAAGLYPRAIELHALLRNYVDVDRHAVSLIGQHDAKPRDVPPGMINRLVGALKRIARKEEAAHEFLYAGNAYELAAEILEGLDRSEGAAALFSMALRAYETGGCTNRMGALHARLEDETSDDD